MAARSYKHVTKSTMVSEFPAIYHVIKGSKVRLDRKIGQNQGILENEGYLKRLIEEEIANGVLDSQSDRKLSMQDVNRVIESLFEEYEREY